MNILSPGMSIFLNFLSVFGKMERWLKNKFMFGAVMVLAALGPGAGRLDAASFTASLDRDTIALGETATLSLTFEGSAPRTIPALPPIPNLQIGNSVSSRNINIVNDQMVSTFSKTFELTPTQTGNYVIPALQTEIDGQIVTSQPLKLTVTQPNAPPAQGINSGSEIAFMKLTLPQDKVYAGEVLVARLDIYLRNDVQNFGNFHFTATPADGFAVGKMVENTKQQVQIGNR